MINCKLLISTYSLLFTINYTLFKFHENIFHILDLKIEI